MRWDRLFEDLEAQFDAADAAEYAGEIVERTRTAIGALRLVDRLRAAGDRPIRLTVLGAGAVRGEVRAVGSEWVVLGLTGGGEALVPLAAIMGVHGLGRHAATPGSEGEVVKRLGLRHALRAIARDRSRCQITTVDGTLVTGTIDRVGADFLEVAELPVGEVRRPNAVRGVDTVPLSAIALVRTA
ncbi:MAG: hypothetical protein ACR2F6_17920 [Mycobacteriales bacterium]